MNGHNILSFRGRKLVIKSLHVCFYCDGVRTGRTTHYTVPTAAPEALVIRASKKNSAYSVGVVSYFEASDAQ